MSQPATQPAPVDPAPSDAAPPPQSTRWLAAVWPVVLIAACAELGIAILNNSALPVYFNKGLKIDTAVIPLLMVPFFISEAVFKLPLGVLADRYGRKPLMVGGATVTIFTPLLLVLLHYNHHMALGVLVLCTFGLLRLLDGLGGAALWPALYAYVGDVVAEQKRGAAMSLLNAVYMVCLAVSFLAGGFADDTFGPVLTGDATLTQESVRVRQRFRHDLHQAGQHLHQAGSNLRAGLGHHSPPALHPHHYVPGNPEAFVQPVYQPAHYWPSFFLASFLFLVATLAAILALRGKAQMKADSAGHAPEEHLTWQTFLESLRTVPQFLGLAFVTFFGIGCIALLVKLFVMDEFGLQEKDVGVLTLWPALVIAALAVPLGHLADKWGKTRAVRLGFVLAAVGLWGIPVLHFLHETQEMGFVLSASVMGLGFVLAFPAWMALLTTVGGENRRGTIMGAVSTAQGVGMLLGALAGGALYSRIDRIAPFVAAAATVTLGAILALIFVRERTVCRQADGTP